MNKKDLIDLLERYERMEVSGQNLYFDADEYESLAEYYDRLDDLEKAKEVVTRGLQIHPNCEQLHLKNAHFLMYDSLYVEALDYLNNHFNGYHYDLFFLKIECYLHLDLFAEAYELSKSLLEDNEADLDVTLSELGFLYIETDNLKEGILYLEKSLEYNAENTEVLSDLAYAYQIDENLERAVEIANKLIDIDPYNSEYWLFLGKIYAQQEEYEKAIDAFDFVSTIDGDDIAFLKLKAHCLLLVGRIQESITILTDCLKELPSDEYLYFSLLDCYFAIEDYSKALDVTFRYQKELGDENPVMLAKRAYIYAILEDSEKALALIAVALEKDGSSYEINTVALTIYIKYEYYEKALTLCYQLLSEDENDIELLNKIVLLALQNTDIETAITYQNKIIELDPTSTQALHKLALLYIENNNKDAFLRCLSSFENDVLKSFFFIFYNKDIFEDSILTRDFMTNYLIEAYNCRILYMGIKY